MLFQQMDSTEVKSATADALTAPPTPSPDMRPATAEVHSAQLQEAPFAKSQAYLQEHVPHWTTEPDFVEWCDPENSEKSLEEDTQKKTNWARASENNSGRIIAEPNYNG